jgi:adenosylmethionine-8-amino-7-oxononanoate aminotransferase
MKVCDSYGVLVIADEVMTGFGRTGRWFACEHFDTRPDIMTMAKGASSGYWPLGLCALSGRVAAAVTESGFVHGFTFSHHPVGAAAGMAVLQRIDELRLVQSAETRGSALLKTMQATLAVNEHVGDVRGIGLMIAVELVEDRVEKTPYPRSAGVAAGVTRLARDIGLIVYPSTGTAGNGLGDILLIGPPLIINDRDLDNLVSMLAQTLEEYPWP